MRSQRPTVADILALKGRRQLTMLRVETLEEAEAAERAGVDMLSVPPALLSPEFRDAAPSAFAVPGLEYGDFITAEEYIRAAFKALRAGGDAVYCAASLATVRSMRNEGIPVCGHVGLIPSQATWTGGFKAVGKTAESAFEIWRQTKALEDAGAFAAEIEVVPVPIATAISERTSLFMISMGAGAGCDAQYLFAQDVLARIVAIIRVTPRSIATSAPNMTACSRKGSQPLQSLSPTFSRRPIPARNILLESRTMSWIVF